MVVVLSRLGQCQFGGVIREFKGLSKACIRIGCWVVESYISIFIRFFRASGLLHKSVRFYLISLYHSLG